MADRRVRIETGEVRPRSIAVFAAGWFALVFVAMALFMVLLDRAGTEPKPPPENYFPAPRLATRHYSEFPSYRARQARELNSYGWRDRARGIAHIPIRKAMAIVAGRPDPYAPLSDPKNGRVP